MTRSRRLGIYVMFSAAIVLGALAAPAAWATPGQDALAQTIPTRTPTSEPVPPTEPAVAETPLPPADDPPANATVDPTSLAVTATVTAQPMLPATPAASCPSASSLTLVADRRAVWPGATVEFTATLTNTGRRPLENVVLEDHLAAGLQPIAVLSGGASWQGRTLRVSMPSLSPGSRLTVVYSARVLATQPGQAIAARAVGTSNGCRQQVASVTLGLPPSQLPPTGASLR